MCFSRSSSDVLRQVHSQNTHSHPVVFMIFYACTTESAPWGGSLILIPNRKGGDAMTVYEVLSLMVTFGTLLVAILCILQQKEADPSPHDCGLLLS
ncbi:putative holin-like toxin [Effusibacillus dendaii]|uniref:putative holin-like toxin n=1 Tax=Effusibacillus dendaii TaxID=2743772 RepID=UPI00384E4683